jgi:signal transduction histidine kinase
MSPSVPCDPVAGPGTAWTAALQRARRRFTRTLAFVLVLCLGIGLLLTAIEGRALGTHTVYALCIGLTCMALTDGARLAAAWATDRLRAARRLPPSPSGFESGWRGIAPAVLLAMFAGPPLGLSLGDLLTGYTSASLLNFSQTSTRFTLVMSLLGTGVSVFVLSTMERLSSARAQAEAAQRLAAENQLRLLQSQLEPHMLFNTLANLRVLIGLDPARAQDMLDHLIAFLRATLDASRSAAHPLAAEFGHLRDYLALMAVRMGPRLAVALDLPAALESLPLPPLLLQPLVENAIKHGLEPKVEGGRIEVSARREGDRLRLAVRDTGVGLGAAVAAGGSTFGLEQVRTRLATLYGSRARLELRAADDGEGGTLALIDMPLTPTP